MSRGCKENKRCKPTVETTNVTCSLRIRCRGPDARLCLRSHDGLVRDSPPPPSGNPAPEHNVKRVEKPQNRVCECVFTVLTTAAFKICVSIRCLLSTLLFQMERGDFRPRLEIFLTKLAKGNTLIGRWR